MADLPKIGIDIGNSSIKLAELAPEGKNKWKLMAAAAMPSIAGGIMGNQNNLAMIAQGLVKLVKESGARSRRVVAALPEEQVSSHVVDMPLMSEEEARQALQWQVEQYIPIPADKASWSYQIIRKDPANNTMEVMLVAAAKNLVNAYMQVLERAGLEIVALETELMATARAIVPNDTTLSLIVDVGSKSTDLGIISAGQMMFSRTIPTAGDAFTRAIETGLGLTTAQAEQYKNTYGFDQSKLEGKLYNAMKPVLTVIAGEIKKTSDFYISKHPGETLKAVFLSGGVSTLPEISSVLSGLVGAEVAAANPFSKVQLDTQQAKALAGDGPFYSVAVGLAEREL